MSVVDRTIVALMPLVPKFIVGRVARPYIAGDTLEDAVRTVRSLMEEGCMATVDVLGEEVDRIEQTEGFTRQYLETLDRIEEEGLDANVSVKLSALGQSVDNELCEENLRKILERARDQGNFVRIDMEDSSTIDRTLDTYRKFRKEFTNLGVVLQSYMKRSMDDIRSLIPLDVNVRVCKGIYVEPPEIAYQDKQKIRDNFMEMTGALLAEGCYTGIATHDRQLVERSFELVERLELDREEYEFQMLLGVLPGLRREIVEAGHRLRVYVPYGEAWYAYSTRRLKENPAVAGHVVRGMFSFGG
ncbi:MAG: proline dehydrogenase family protein [bacterium]